MNQLLVLPMRSASFVYPRATIPLNPVQRIYFSISNDPYELANPDCAARENAGSVHVVPWRPCDNTQKCGLTQDTEAERTSIRAQCPYLMEHLDRTKPLQVH